MDDDKLLLFSELIVVLAARLGGRRIHQSTLHRWRARGHLKSVRIGGRWFSTLAAFDRMCAPHADESKNVGNKSRSATVVQVALKSNHGF